MCCTRFWINALEIEGASETVRAFLVLIGIDVQLSGLI